MTDRELLEMAAKAEGRTLKYMTQHIKGREPETFIACWNPLTDDGDALRLLAAIPSLWTLNLNFGPMIKMTVHRAFDDDISCFSNEGDRAQDIRLVITRAAAEVGKAQL